MGLPYFEVESSFKYYMFGFKTEAMSLKDILKFHKNHYDYFGIGECVTRTVKKDEEQLSMLADIVRIVGSEHL